MLVILRQLLDQLGQLFITPGSDAIPAGFPYI